jgi:hypothetical protein
MAKKDRYGSITYSRQVQGIGSKKGNRFRYCPIDGIVRKETLTGLVTNRVGFDRRELVDIGICTRTAICGFARTEMAVPGLKSNEE